MPGSRACSRPIPSCAIAYWGIALTHWGNPFAGLRSAQAIAAGKAAIDKGQATGSPTPREKGYIDAVAGLFSSADAGTQRARVLAYEKATEAVAAQNPGDTEARIFWALAIDQTALPTDKSFAQNLRAAEILEPLYKKMPNHPGLAHYIIHTYDVPALADKALPAAARLRRHRPGRSARAPHAVAHLHARRPVEGVGRHQHQVGGGGGEDRRSRRSAARPRLPDLCLPADGAGRAGQGRARSRDVGERRGAGRRGGRPAAAPTRLRSRPFRRATRWSACSGPDGDGADRAARPEHALYRSDDPLRARGRRRPGGKPADAAADIARLREIHDREIELKDAYWAEQVDIQRRVAEAWVAYASGQKDDGIRLLAGAADAEDLTDKSAVTPGPLAPARELYGFMLLEAGRAKDALEAFEAVAKKEPNRFLALYGAGKAAEASKQPAKAKSYYKQIVTICADAAPDRPELVYARKMAK